jgi:hypothetical protein
MDPLEIPSETLLQLADALDVGHVRGPLTKLGLRAFTTSAGAVSALEELRQTAGGETALASICRGASSPLNGAARACPSSFTIRARSTTRR